MNIIDINFKKLRECINDYILCNNHEIYLSTDIVIEYNKPIVLMNNDTLNLLKTKHKYYITNNSENSKNVPTIFGCYIAIADWLPFGEVILK